MGSALDSLIASGACHLDFGCEDARLAVDSGGRNWCLVRYSAPPVGAWLSFTKGRLDLPEHTIAVDGRVRAFLPVGLRRPTMPERPWRTSSTAPRGPVGWLGPRHAVAPAALVDAVRAAVGV